MLGIIYYRHYNPGTPAFTASDINGEILIRCSHFLSFIRPALSLDDLALEPGFDRAGFGGGLCRKDGPEHPQEVPAGLGSFLV